MAIIGTLIRGRIVYYGLGVSLKCPSLLAQVDLVLGLSACASYCLALAR